MNLWRHIDDAKTKREALEAMASDTPEQIAAKVVLYADAEESVAKLKAASDVLLALELKGLKGSAHEAERAAIADQMMVHWHRGLKELRAFADGLLKGRRTLHWPLAYPEIMGTEGFDAFVGNPPFLGGRRISFRLSSDLLEYLKGWLLGPAGTTDLCVYFLLRAHILACRNGHVGLVVSDIVSQGESRTNGLEHLLANGSSIHVAVKSTDWPGEAGVKIAILHLAKGDWLSLIHISEPTRPY